MGQVLHGSATTTEAVRRAIQHSQESLRALAGRYGINPKTVAKWKRRFSAADLPTGLKEPRSTVLSVEDEAVIVAFRKHTLLPLDDCLYALQATIPHLTRSSLHRCLQRHGIGRLPTLEGDKPAKKALQSLSDRLLPYRYCRDSDCGRQALPVRRHRSDQQVRLRPASGKGQPGDRSAFPDGTRCGGSLQNPHRPDRQRHPVPACRPATPTAQPVIEFATHMFEMRCRGERHRASVHQDQRSLDEWAGREDEPDHQRSDRPALSL